MTDVKCEIAKAAGFGGVPECGNRHCAHHLGRFVRTSCTSTCYCCCLGGCEVRLLVSQSPFYTCLNLKKGEGGSRGAIVSVCFFFFLPFSFLFWHLHFQRSDLAVTGGSISYQWLLKTFSSRGRFLKSPSSLIPFCLFVFPTAFPASQPHQCAFLSSLLSSLFVG